MTILFIKEIIAIIKVMEYLAFDASDLFSINNKQNTNIKTN